MMEHGNSAQLVKLFIAGSAIGHVELSSYIQFVTEKLDLSLYIKGRLEERGAKHVFLKCVDSLSVERTVLHQGCYYSVCALRPSQCALGYRRLQSCLTRHFAVVGYITDYQFLIMNQSSINRIDLKLNYSVPQNDGIICIVKSNHSSNLRSDTDSSNISFCCGPSEMLSCYGSKTSKSICLSAETLRLNFNQQHGQLLEQTGLTSTSTGSKIEHTMDRDKAFLNQAQSVMSPNRKRHKSEGVSVLGKSPLLGMISSKIRKRHRTSSNASSVSTDAVERCDIASENEGSVNKFIDKNERKKDIIQVTTDSYHSKERVHKDKHEYKKNSAKKHSHKSSKYCKENKKTEKEPVDTPKKSSKVSLLDKLEHSLMGGKKKDRVFELKTRKVERHHQKSSKSSSKSRTKADNQHAAEQVFSSVFNFAGLTKHLGRIPKKAKPDIEVASPAVSDCVKQVENSHDVTANKVPDKILKANLDDGIGLENSHIPSERGESLEMFENINKGLDIKSMVTDALYSGGIKSSIDCHKSQAIPGLGDFHELALLREMEKKSWKPRQRTIRVTECDLKISFKVNDLSKQRPGSSHKADIRDILYIGLFGKIVCTAMQMECKSMHECVLSVHSMPSSTWNKSIIHDGKQMYKITLSRTVASLNASIMSENVMINEGVKPNLNIESRKVDSVIVSTTKHQPVKRVVDKLLVIPVPQILDYSDDEDDDEDDDNLRNLDEIGPPIEDLHTNELHDATVQDELKVASSKEDCKESCLGSTEAVPKAKHAVSGTNSSLSSNKMTGTINKVTDNSMSSDVDKGNSSSEVDDDGARRKASLMLSKEDLDVVYGDRRKEDKQADNKPSERPGNYSHERDDDSGCKDVATAKTSSHDDSLSGSRKSTSSELTDKLAGESRKNSSHSGAETRPDTNSREDSSCAVLESKSRKTGSCNVVVNRSDKSCFNIENGNRIPKSSSPDEFECRPRKSSSRDKSESRTRKGDTRDELESQFRKNTSRDESESRVRKSSSHGESESRGRKSSSRDDSESRARKSSSRDDSESRARKSSSCDDPESRARKGSSHDELESRARKSSSKEHESRSTTSEKSSKESSDKSRSENIATFLQKIATTSEIDIDKCVKTDRAEKRRNRQYHPYKKEKSGHHTPHWSFDLAYSDMNELLQNLTENTYKRLRHVPVEGASRRRQRSGRRNDRQGRFCSYAFIRSTVYRTPPREESSSEDEIDLKDIPELKTRAQQADILEEKFLGTGKDEGQFSREKEIYEKDMKDLNDKKRKLGPPLAVPGGPRTSTFSRVDLSEDGDDDDELAFGIRNRPTQEADNKQKFYSYSLKLIKETLSTVRTENKPSNKNATCKDGQSRTNANADTAEKTDKDVKKKETSKRSDAICANKTQLAYKIPKKGFKIESKDNFKVPKKAEFSEASDDQVTTNGNNGDRGNAQKDAESGNSNVELETAVLKKVHSNKILSSESEECFDWSDEDETLDKDGNLLNESFDEMSNLTLKNCYVVVDSLEESEIGDMKNKSSLGRDSENSHGKSTQIQAKSTCGDEAEITASDESTYIVDTCVATIDVCEASSVKKDCSGHVDNAEAKPEMDKDKELDSFLEGKKDASVDNDSYLSRLPTKTETDFPQKLEASADNCLLLEESPDGKADSNGKSVPSASHASTVTITEPNSFVCETNILVKHEFLSKSSGKNVVNKLVCTTGNNSSMINKEIKKDQLDHTSASNTEQEEDVDQDLRRKHQLSDDSCMKEQLPDGTENKDAVVSNQCTKEHNLSNHSGEEQNSGACGKFGSSKLNDDFINGIATHGISSWEESRSSTSLDGPVMVDVDKNYSGNGDQCVEDTAKVLCRAADRYLEDNDKDEKNNVDNFKDFKIDITLEGEHQNMSSASSKDIEECAKSCYIEPIEDKNKDVIVKPEENNKAEGHCSSSTSKPIIVDLNYNVSDQSVDDSNKDKCAPALSSLDDNSKDDNSNSDNYEILKMDISLDARESIDHHESTKMDSSEESRHLDMSSFVNEKAEECNVESNKCLEQQEKESSTDTQLEYNEVSGEIVAKSTLQSCSSSVARKSPSKYVCKLDDEAVIVVKDSLNENDGDTVVKTCTLDNTLSHKKDVPSKQNSSRGETLVHGAQHSSTSSNLNLNRLNNINGNYCNTPLDDYNYNTWAYNWNTHTGMPYSSYYADGGLSGNQYSPTTGLEYPWQQFQGNYLNPGLGQNYSEGMGHMNTGIWTANNPYSPNMTPPSILVAHNRPVLLIEQVAPPVWNNYTGFSQSPSQSAFAAAPWIMSPGHMTPYMSGRNPNTFYVTQADTASKANEIPSPKKCEGNKVPKYKDNLEISEGKRSLLKQNDNKNIGNNELDIPVSEIPLPSTCQFINPESLVTLCSKYVKPAAIKWKNKSNDDLTSGEHDCAITNQSYIHPNNIETLQVLSKKCYEDVLSGRQGKSSAFGKCDKSKICDQIMCPENSDKAQSVSSLKAMCRNMLTKYIDDNSKCPPNENHENCIKEVLNDVLLKIENQDFVLSKLKNHNVGVQNFHIVPECSVHEQTSVNETKDLMKVSVECNISDEDHSLKFAGSYSQGLGAGCRIDAIVTKDLSNQDSKNLSSPEKQHEGLANTSQNIPLNEKAIDMDEELKLFYESIKDIAQDAVEEALKDIPIAGIETGLVNGLGYSKKVPVKVGSGLFCSEGSSEEAIGTNIQDKRYQDLHRCDSPHLPELLLALSDEKDCFKEPCNESGLVTNGQSVMNENVDANKDKKDELPSKFCWQVVTVDANQSTSHDSVVEDNGASAGIDKFSVGQINEQIFCCPGNAECTVDSGIDSEKDVHSDGQNVLATISMVDLEQEDIETWSEKQNEIAKMDNLASAVKSSVDQNKVNVHAEMSMENSIKNASKTYTHYTKSAFTCKTVVDNVKAVNSLKTPANDVKVIENEQPDQPEKNDISKTENAKFEKITVCVEKTNVARFDNKAREQEDEMDEQMRLFYACIQADEDVDDEVTSGFSDSSNVCVIGETQDIDTELEQGFKTSCVNSGLISVNGNVSDTNDVFDEEADLMNKTISKYTEDDSKYDFEIDDVECETLPLDAEKETDAFTCRYNRLSYHADKPSECDINSGTSEQSLNAPEDVPIDNVHNGNILCKHADSLNVISMAYAETEHDNSNFEIASAETHVCNETHVCTETQVGPETNAFSASGDVIPSSFDNVSQSVNDSPKTEIDDLMRCKWTEHEVYSDETKQERGSTEDVTVDILDKDSGENGSGVVRQTFTDVCTETNVFASSGEVSLSSFDDVSQAVINSPKTEVDDLIGCKWTEHGVCSDEIKQENDNKGVGTMESIDKNSDEKYDDIGRRTCTDVYLKSRGIIRATDSSTEIMYPKKDSRIVKADSDENDQLVKNNFKRRNIQYRLQSLSNQSSYRAQKSKVSMRDGWKKQKSAGFRKELHYKVLMNASFSNSKECKVKRGERKDSDIEVEERNKYVTQWLYDNETGKRLEQSPDTYSGIIQNPLTPDLSDKSSVSSLSSSLSSGNLAHTKFGSKVSYSDTSQSDRSRESSVSNSLSSSECSRSSALKQKRQYRRKMPGISSPSSSENDTGQFRANPSISTKKTRNVDNYLNGKNGTDYQSNRRSRRYSRSSSTSSGRSLSPSYFRNRRYRRSNRKSRSPIETNGSSDKSTGRFEDSYRGIKSSTDTSLESSTKYINRSHHLSRKNKSPCNRSHGKKTRGERIHSSSSECRNRSFGGNVGYSENYRSLCESPKVKDRSHDIKGRSIKHRPRRGYVESQSTSDCRSDCSIPTGGRAFRSPNESDQRSRRDCDRKCITSPEVYIDGASRWPRCKSRKCKSTAVEDVGTSETMIVNNDVGAVQNPFKNRTLRQEKRVLLLTSLLRSTKMSELVYILQKLVQHSSTCCQWILTFLSSQLATLEPSLCFLIQRLEHEHSCIQIIHSVDNLDSYVVMELKDTNVAEIYIITEPLAQDENVRSIIKYCSLDTFLNKYLS